MPQSTFCGTPSPNKGPRKTGLALSSSPANLNVGGRKKRQNRLANHNQDKDKVEVPNVRDKRLAKIRFVG